MHRRQRARHAPLASPTKVQLICSRPRSQTLSGFPVYVARLPPAPLSVLQRRGRANLRGFRVDRARLGSSAAAQPRARSYVAVNSNAPSRRDRKNKVDQAIQDHNRRRERSAPPIPTPPTAIRSRRVVPIRTAAPPGLRRADRHRLAAMQTKTDKNPESRPAEFPRAVDRLSVDEFVQAIVGRTIPVPLRSDEISRGEQNLRFPVQADRRRFLIAADREYFQGRRPSSVRTPPFGREATHESHRHAPSFFRALTQERLNQARRSY